MGRGAVYISGGATAFLELFFCFILIGDGRAEANLLLPGLFLNKEGLLVSSGIDIESILRMGKLLSDLSDGVRFFLVIDPLLFYFVNLGLVQIIAIDSGRAIVRYN